MASGLDTPWAIAWLPDRRALVTERPGRVRLLSAAGELRDEPVGEVDVVESDGSESGLLGIAVDPEFADNGFVYLYRTTGDGNEVARYRFADDRLTEDGVVVEGIQAGPIHNGGRLAFGPDDRLYITTGEVGDASLAQADGLNGKVLRTADFRSDGVRARGLHHRPPQRPGHRLGAGQRPPPHHRARAGPRRRGQRPARGRRLRLARRRRGEAAGPLRGRHLALRSDVRVRETGDFVFANLGGEQLRRLSFDGERVAGDEPLLEGEYGRLRDVAEGPDGDLYVLTSNRDGRGDPEDDDDRILRLTPP